MRKEERKERMRKVRKKESEGGKEGGRGEGKKKGEREASQFSVSSFRRYTKQLLLSASHTPFQTAHGLGYLLREDELWHR